MSAYENLPLSSLQKQLDELLSKYTALSMAEGDNAAALEKASKIMKELGDAIKAKSSSAPEAKVEVATLGTSEAKFNYNSMLAHMRANIPTLQPPLDVSVFIQRLENCYNLFVKPFQYLEPYFIQQAKGHLSSDILENLNASEDATDDFASLKTYLKKNYGSKETPFQIMSELLESAPKEGERIQEWAARQERRSDIVATQIISKFNEHAKQSSKPEMTVKDSFNLFCSMVTYDYIRKNKPDCFKLMVKEVDTCWRPTEVGSLAATLVDRIDKIDPAAHPAYSARQNQQKQPKNKNGKKKGKPKNDSKSDTCVLHLFDMCKLGDRCHRKHLSGKEFDNALENAKKGKKKNNVQKPAPNTNVATTNSHTEDLQPEFVGQDFFDLHCDSKN